MITWGSIELGIQAWIQAVTGLDDGHVIWANSDAPRPVGDFVELRAEVQRTGQGWTTTEDNPTPSPGAELIVSKVNQKILSLRIKYVGGSNRGIGSCVAKLDHLQDLTDLELYRKPLRDSGWTPNSYTRILPISGNIGQAKLETRAEVTAVGGVASKVGGTATYIQFIEFTNAVGDTTIIDLDPA